MAENLVLANLTIDADGTVRGIAKGVSALRKGEQSVDRFGKSQITAGKATQGFLGRLGGLPGLLGRIGIAAGIAAGAFAAWRALTSVIRSVSDALRRGVTLAGEYERNAVILTQTIGSQADEMLRYADALQRATQFTDDQIVPAMVQLANITGATGDELKELTQLTLDVAVTFNRNLNDSAILVAKSAQGVTDRLNELGFTIDKSITGKAERGAAALALLQDKTVAAQDSAQTYSGTLLRLSSVWDSLLRNIGKLLTQSGVLREALNRIVEVLGRMSDTIATIDGQKFNEKVVRPLALGFGALSVAIIDSNIALIEQAQTLASLPSKVGINLVFLKMLEDRWNNTVLSLKAARKEAVKFFAEVAAGTTGFAPEKPPTPETPELPAATQAVDLFAFAGISSPAVIEATVSKVTEAFAVIRAAEKQNMISAEALGSAQEHLIETLVGLQLPAEELESILTGLGVQLETTSAILHEPPELGPWQEFLKGLSESFTLAQVSMDAFQTGVSQLGGTLGSVFAGESVSIKNAIRQILVDIAQMFATYGVTQLALGAIASTPWGAAILGPPGPYFRAAGVAFLAAAIAGGAARAVGGGGGGSTGGGGGRRGARLAGGGFGGGGGQNVTVQVQGSIIGTDPNELARSIAKLINTNRRDGSF